LYINKEKTKLASLSESTIKSYEEMSDLYTIYRNQASEISAEKYQELNDRLASLTSDLEDAGLQCRDCYYYTCYTNSNHRCMRNVKNYDPTMYIKPSTLYPNGPIVISAHSLCKVWSCLKLDLKGHDDPLKGFQLF